MFRKITIRIIGIVLMLFANTASATRYYGGHITTRPLGNNKFEVRIILYNDCTSPGLSISTFNLKASSGPDKINPGVPTLVSTREISGYGSGCQIQSTCQNANSTYLGIQEHLLLDTLDLSGFSSCNWIVTYNTCCRSGQITNGGANKDMFLQTQFDRCIGKATPVFIRTPQMICTNRQDVRLSFAVEDTIDGFDSVSYHIVDPWQYLNTSIPYGGLFEASRPISFFGFPDTTLKLPGGYHLDPITGELRFRLSGFGNHELSSIAVEVREYIRLNGAMELSSSIRQEITLACVFQASAFGSPHFEPEPEGNYGVCLGDTFRLVLNTNPLSNGDSTFVEWKHRIPGLNISSSNYTDKNALLTLEWVPLSSDVREAAYTLSLDLYDNLCPANRHQFYAINIYVRDSVPPIRVDLGADIIDSIGRDSLAISANVTNRFFRIGTWRTDGDGKFQDSTGTETIYVKGTKDKKGCATTLWYEIFNRDHCFDPNGKYADTMEIQTVRYAPDAGVSVNVRYDDTVKLDGTWNQLGHQLAWWRSDGDGYFSDSLDAHAEYYPGPGDWNNCNWKIRLITGGNNCQVFEDSLLVQRLPRIPDAGADASVMPGDTLFLTGMLDGRSDLQVEWTTLGDGAFGDSSKPETWYIPGQNDLYQCSAALILKEFPAPACISHPDTMFYVKLLPSLDAGVDQTTFFETGLSFQLDGSTNSAYHPVSYWSTAGDGTFDDSLKLNATYTPGQSDLFTCNVKLRLNEYPPSSCYNFDEVDLEIRDSAASILYTSVDSFTFDTVYIHYHAVPSRANLSWSSSGTGTFMALSPGVEAYVLSSADKSLTYIELNMQNTAPCLTSQDQVVIDPSSKLINNVIRVARGIRMYPNPAHDKIRVEWEESGRFISIVVTDITGKELLTSEVGDLSASANLNTLTSGAYILQLNGKDGSRVLFRFIKK